MLQDAADLDSKAGALQQETWQWFSVALAGAPVPHLWDLLESLFGEGSESASEYTSESPSKKS